MEKSCCGHMEKDDIASQQIRSLVNKTLIRNSQWSFNLVLMTTLCTIKEPRFEFDVSLTETKQNLSISTAVIVYRTVEY